MKNLIATLRLIIVSMIVCCVLYPLVLLGFARLAAPEKAIGCLVHGPDGRIVGSRLIAQGFTRPEYFWPRPSAVDYNAAAAGGSNLSPTNRALTVRAKETIARLRPAPGAKVPADLVAASGSGLDPHITLDGARLQMPRVAAARRLSEDAVEAMIMQNAEVPTLRVFGGKPVVNVLQLNLQLDRRGRMNEAWPRP